MKIRQQAPTLSGIRDDHVARYQFAIDQMRELEISGHILDVGCGVGYGCNMMSNQHDSSVILGIDLSVDAIQYASEHYATTKIAFVIAGMEITNPIGFNIITMFEVIEHSDMAPAFMAKASLHSKYLFGSVPNEDVVPFAKGKYNDEHYRHYTPGEIRLELENAGWWIHIIGSQIGKRGSKAAVEPKNTSGRTIVFMAESVHA